MRPRSRSYFLIHQAEIIQKSLHALHVYFAQESQDKRRAIRLLDHRNGLNKRQHALLTHALRHPSHTYTIAEHQSVHRVAYATARADLLGLVAVDFFAQRQRGKAMIFISPADLDQRMESLARATKGYSE